MQRFSWIVGLFGTAGRAAHYTVRELSPWVVHAVVGWLVGRLGGRAGEPVKGLCPTCPFLPPGATGAAVPLDKPPRPQRPSKAHADPTGDTQAGPALVVIAILLAFVMIAMSSGGCAPTSVQSAADRATYDAIAPEYAAYVDADPTLDTARKQRRLRTLDAWRVRLEAAEQATDLSVSDAGPR